METYLPWILLVLLVIFIITNVLYFISIRNLKRVFNDYKQATEFYIKGLEDRQKLYEEIYNKLMPLRGE